MYEVFVAQILLCDRWVFVTIYAGSACHNLPRFRLIQGEHRGDD